MSSLSVASKTVVGLLIALSISAPGVAKPADEPTELLARAEALYYEADFAKSVELLLRADELLQKESGPLQKKTDVKLQLALGFLGLNDRTQAKRYLQELYALDADHRIDPEMFSPKVLQLAEEAKADQNELRCRAVLDRTQRALSSGNSADAATLIGSNSKTCAGLAPLSTQVGDLFFKEGLEAYRKAQMQDAVGKFRAALTAAPQHELAAQYLELTQSKLEIAADRVLIAWRKEYNSGDYATAGREYRELASRGNSASVDEVRAEYRKTLSGLVDAWNRACAGNDPATMEEIRLRVDALVPEPSFVEDLLAKMKTCKPTGCVQMSAPLALARVRNRVNPQFPGSVISQLKVSPITVRIKARISETGDVVSSEFQGGSPLLYPAIHEAFQQWKFSPAVTQSEARCVDTEIPIVINFTPK